MDRSNFRICQLVSKKQQINIGYPINTANDDLALTTIQKIDKRYQFSCSANFFKKEYELLYNTLSK